jgi:GNAT superfamily N-acetyltransferase
VPEAAVIEASWELVEVADAADLATLHGGVTAAGRALAAEGQARPIACLVREAGRLVAGGAGRTEYARLFVNHLWVAEPLRGHGIGPQVLAALETAARRRGCTDTLIETLDDRVAELYRRCGYAEVARLPGYVGPFTRYVLVKPLAAASDRGPAPDALGRSPS